MKSAMAAENLTLFNAAELGIYLTILKEILQISEDLPIMKWHVDIKPLLSQFT